MKNNRLNLNLIELNQPLPEWHLETIFGDEIPTIKDFEGKPLLILFFSLGCPGCLGRAIPYANRISYDDKINVLGIHTNFEGIDFNKEKFEEAKKKLFVRFPFFKDYNYDTTFLDYGAGGTPHWILVDSEGKVDYSIFGSEPNNALLRLEYRMENLLNKK